jgi:hypothetical protein
MCSEAHTEHKATQRTLVPSQSEWAGFGSDRMERVKGGCDPEPFVRPDLGRSTGQRPMVDQPTRSIHNEQMQEWHIVTSLFSIVYIDALALSLSLVPSFIGAQIQQCDKLRKTAFLHRKLLSRR